MAASTHNQALNALLFLFKVLGKEIGLVNGVVRAKRPPRLPVVLSREEVRAVLGLVSGTTRLMATLLYGTGLRLMECCRLRVKDLDFHQNQIVVRAAMKDKKNYVVLGSRKFLIPEGNPWLVEQNGKLVIAAKGTVYIQQ